MRWWHPSSPNLRQSVGKTKGKHGVQPASHVVPESPDSQLCKDRRIKRFGNLGPQGTERAISRSSNSQVFVKKPSSIHNPNPKTTKRFNPNSPKLQIHDYMLASNSWKSWVHLPSSLALLQFHPTWNPAASKRSFAWCSSCAWPLCGGFMAPVVNTTLMAKVGGVMGSWGWKKRNKNGCKYM